MYKKSDPGPTSQQDSEPQEWIAIEPPSPRVRRIFESTTPRDDQLPPSFTEAQFDIILRRQRLRSQGDGGRKTSLPSRFLNLDSGFEFAGWGTFQHLRLEKDDISLGERALGKLSQNCVLGQFTASALAGNAVLGSVFYALPAVVAVAGVYSPISLLVASFFLFLWRPMMEELVSALSISGGPYTYILNVSTKPFALISAALLLLDFASTSVVSAATAASYLAGEVHLPFHPFVPAVLVLVLFTIISLTGIKESARIALVVLLFHLASMLALILASIVYWGQMGNHQLQQNWHQHQAPSTAGTLRQVYYGICLGMLGLTGFECTPSYVARIMPGRFPKVLRNMHYPAIILNALMMLLLLAVAPVDEILSGANVLSLLAEKTAGRWLRIWVVADAIIVLCGGVLTGILSACELFQQLSQDRVIPTFFLRVLPLTGSPYVSVLTFAGFSGLIYATTGANLVVISEMFSLVWLTVMSLFPISLLLLKYNRGRLRREKRASLSIIVSALVIALTVFVGNIIVDPATAGYFAAYVIGLVIIFSATQNKVRLLRWVYWLYDQCPSLHTNGFSNGWGQRLVKTITLMKRQPVCILIKTDEIHHLFRMILYVQKNEETSRVKIVHFCDAEGGVPTELEANAKILDEAFPEITIDLVIVNDVFEPAKIFALSHALGIPNSLMFMSCPGTDFPYSIADLGTRIIAL